MISYIRGELAAVQEQKAIVEAGGIGYGIYMSQQTLSMLPAVGEEVKIHTYLNVREDAMQLYGFLTGEDLQVFRLLIGVSGIGPKAGLNILSCLSPDELRFAVLAGDVKTISSAPGIGKKTAEKLILELKDKMSIEDVLEQAAHGGELSKEIEATDTGMLSVPVPLLPAFRYLSPQFLLTVHRHVLPVPKHPQCSSYLSTQESAFPQSSSQFQELMKLF